jgi:hypothetical protein
MSTEPIKKHFVHRFPSIEHMIGPVKVRPIFVRWVSSAARVYPVNDVITPNAVSCWAGLLRASALPKDYPRWFSKLKHDSGMFFSPFSWISRIHSNYVGFIGFAKPSIKGIHSTSDVRVVPHQVQQT